MENSKEDQKPGSVCNQESHTNDEPQNNQENPQRDVSVGPMAKISSPSPSHDSHQQQQPPIVQWPYIPQNATEQLLAMHFPTQASPPPVTLNQWQHFPCSQVFAPSASPYWQPQPRSQPPGAFFHPFTDNTGFQGRPPSTIPTLIPNMSYHYTFPLQYSWGPSSYMAQLYQMQHPYVFSFPGALNSPTTKVSDCLTSSGEDSFQRGIMRPPSKLSQKHQQLCETLSAENAQLWSVINKLQAEVSDYKDRLQKLEDDVSSFKQKSEVSSNKVIGTIPVLTPQPKKRGRPKQSMASVDASYVSRLPSGSKKPALNNSLYQSKSPFGEVKSPMFEKVILKKVENKEITTPSTTTMAQCKSNANNLINQRNPVMSACHPVHQEYQGIRTRGSGVNVNFGKEEDLKVVNSEPSQLDKVLNNSSLGVSAIPSGKTGYGNDGLTSDTPSQDTAKEVARPSFFHNDSFIQQGGDTTPVWCLSFANEEDASGDIEDPIQGSAKDENEVKDDTCSAAEEIGVTKDLGGWLPHE